jgi:hypothetical protein
MRMTEHAERSPGCLSRLHCDQLLNGELEDRDDLKRHHASCPRCTALLATHRRERAAFDVPFAMPPARAPRRWPVGLAAVAAAFGLWLVASPERHDEAGTRSKGKPALSFYVKHGEVVREGGSGEAVVPNDAINFTVSIDAPAFLAIVSVDGAGKLSAYYPEGPAAAAIPAGNDQVLPRSVLLDDTLGRERVVAVFCDRPVLVAELAAAVARDAIPSSCMADTVTLDKRRAP